MALRVLMVNKTDQAGGAAKAAYRLHQGMRIAGHDSWLLVDERTGNDPYTITPEGWFTQKKQVLAARLERRAEKSLNATTTHQVLSQGMGTNILLDFVKKYKPDVIHLHWVNRGQVSIKTLSQLKVPIVWTLHDMWPFTGNCHFPPSCNNYEGGCGQCPIMNSNSLTDASRSVYDRKLTAWKGLKMAFAAPSNWMADAARQSRLVKEHNITVKTIGNGLDTKVFYPKDKFEARKQLGLQLYKPYLLFGAAGATSDPRKGFHYLIQAIKTYKDQLPEELEIIIFGAEAGQQFDLPFPTHNLGKLTSEEQLVRAYSAADLFVAPSLQDNLPNTIMEAMACGTTVAAFDTGGIRDLVQHGHNGYLATPSDAESLAMAITSCLDQAHILSPEARAHVVRNYDHVKQAGMYHRLYNEMLF